MTSEAAVAAVLGLGPMGRPIAEHLAARFATEVWNRTPQVAAELADRARVVARPDAISAAAVFACLPDIDQLDQVAPDAVLTAWRANGVERVVVLSTTSPAKVRGFAARAAASGLAVVDAPMSGGDAGAREARLSLMVGGDAAELEAVRPLLETFATTIRHLGPVGAGAAGKLANQLVVAGTLAALAEALDLARRADVDDVALVDLLRGGLASSAVLDLKADKLLGRHYELGGSTANQVKDLVYATGLADELGAELRLSRAALDLYRRAVDAGFGQQDHAAVQEILRRD
ncbi:NAD(P)-dependent oxidoreductase [Schumannella luteola]|uniref:2-hydroxy-3-oxopropionate reductase n=1 Tax=Schumannella luteola TaxID=472059 RepID=A0A852Y8N3_9MICO|nr:NAD(P)-dependent oxidoreductase [Schumannella luteola]NYG97664.1 2-hydroxy-3-oxopropionate reductase [Schumannella luteola]TPX01460.1 NAD(P)-dependent oxidoreductase [Schumannella luteola]